MGKKLLIYLTKFLIAVVAPILFIGCASGEGLVRTDDENNLEQTMNILSPLDPGNMGYLNRHELRDSRYSQSVSIASRKGSFGALRFNKSDPTKDDSVVTIYRKGRNFMAESMLLKTKNTKYFLSLGYDKVTRMPRAGFKVEF